MEGQNKPGSACVSAVEGASLGDGGRRGDVWSGTSRFLAFRLHTEDYAIPLLRVKEVIALPETTPVPQTPSYFLGIMNLRGQIVSVIDLRLKLGLSAENTEDTSVIICDLEPLCLGVVVSSVTNVLALSHDEIGASPAVSRGDAEFVMGVAKLEKNMVLIIDIALALGVEDHLEIHDRQDGPAQETLSLS